MNTYILVGMNTLIEEEWMPDKAIIIKGGKIEAIISAALIHNHLPAKVIRVSETSKLVPGFIDLHVHGARGKDVMDDDDHTLPTICKALAQEGVTGFLPTTITSEISTLERTIARIRNQLSYSEGAAILGMHLEGPFIANEKKGAHPNSDILSPDLQGKLIEEWQSKAGGSIKMMTLAPELPGALNLIQSLLSQGIIPAIGHSNASYAEAEAAILSGCKHATHLFNAMRVIHQREPGVVMAVLLSERVTADLIADGIHVHPRMLELAWKLKGPNHLMLITDAMRAKGCQSGRYQLANQSVQVENGEARLSDGTLAGSTLTMPKAISNMVAYTGCSLIEAVLMASYYPARLLGLEDRKGAIKVNMDADLTILDKDNLVEFTMVGGRVVYQHMGQPELV